MTYVPSKHLKGLSGPVLITGHTGFKGTWMTFLLKFLGVPVVGYSLPAKSESLYYRADRVGNIL
jgi:CDP-glucose 4,6-dehydratase